MTEGLVQELGIQTKPKVIDLTTKEATVDTLTEARINCGQKEKVCAIASLPLLLLCAELDQVGSPTVGRLP